MIDWLNVILQGVLVGGLYAMFAAGLSLIFGVMRLVNIAHGDLIVLAAYLALVTTQTLGIGPLTSLLVVVPLMAAIGYALQRLVLNRTLGDDLLPPLLVTFGLSVIIQNGLLDAVHRRQPQKLQAGDIEVATFRLIEGVFVGVLPLIQFVVAVAVIGALQFMFYRTALGRAFRATSDDPAGGAAHGSRQPPRLRAGDGAVARGRRDRRRVPRGARQFRSGDRAGAPDLRLRGGDHRRARQPLGHARRRHHPRRRAGDRRAARSRLAASRRPSRVPRRARGPAGGPVPEGAADERARRIRQPLEPHRHARSARSLLIALAAAPFWGGRDDLRLLAEIYAYVALASLWNLLAGYAGLVSVGQQAYVGLGAYLLFALAILAGIPPLWAIPIAGLIAAMRRDSGRGLIFRLRGHYFAIGTWIVAEVFRLLASQVSALGGGSGISLPAGIVTRDRADAGRCASS